MGGSVIAISVDSPEDNLRVRDNNDLPFDILSDSKLEAIKAYGLLFHEPARDIDIALPANFLINRNGKTVWQWIPGRVQDRVDPAIVAEEVDKLKSAG